MTFKTIKTSEAMTANKPDGHLHVRFVNVGQGDFITVKTPLGRSIVVDCGSVSRENYGFTDLAKVIFGYNMRRFTDKDLTKKDRKRAKYDPADYPGYYVADKNKFIAEYEKSDETLITPKYNRLDFLFLTHPDIDHYSQVPAFLGFHADLNLGAGVDLQHVFISDDFGHFAKRNINGFIVDALKRSRTTGDGDSESDIETSDADDIDDVLEERIHRLRVNSRANSSGEWKCLLQETVSKGRVFKLYCLVAGVEATSAYSLSDAAMTNARSLVLLLEYGKDRIMLTGDANRFTEPAIRNAIETDDPDQQPKIALLQIPHHGSSKDQLSRPLFKLIAAQRLVVSAPGDSRSHFHPRYTTISIADQHTRSLVNDNSVLCWFDPREHKFIRIAEDGDTFIFIDTPWKQKEHQRRRPEQSSPRLDTLEREIKYLTYEDTETVSMKYGSRNMYLVKFDTYNEIFSTGSRQADMYETFNGL